MERIKDALDKAKKNQSPDVKLERKELHMASPVVGLPNHGQTDLSELSYKHTRVVNLDPAHLERHRIFAHNKNNLHTNIFDLLRTQVLQKMSENNWRTLAIVSPTPAAGKSLVSINLAISIAHHSEKSSILVDFDLRRPSVAKYLGLKMDRSLNELLDGTCDIPDILVSPGIPRFVVMAPQRQITNSTEVLASKQVQKLIKELRDRYDERVVIFDLPPLLNADDAMAVLPHIDCALMVIPNGMLSKREIEDSFRYIPSTNLIGTVLNKAQGNNLQYSYY